MRHPDLAAVGGEMRAQWRAETEAATEDAAAQWRHARTLVDWLTERMHAGDKIAVVVSGQRFAGTVEEAGPDLIALRAVFGRVDIHLMPGISLFVEMHDKATVGGQRAQSSRTFREALLVRDGRDDQSVGTVHDPEGLDGALFVGADFLSVVAKLGRETVVPLDAVTWVCARRV
jgi:hypothetical protein